MTFAVATLAQTFYTSLSFEWIRVHRHSSGILDVLGIAREHQENNKRSFDVEDSYIGGSRSWRQREEPSKNNLEPLGVTSAPRWPKSARHAWFLNRFLPPVPQTNILPRPRERFIIFIIMFQIFIITIFVFSHSLEDNSVFFFRGRVKM